jgi:hypothetical protein
MEAVSDQDCCITSFISGGVPDSLVVSSGSVFGNCAKSLEGDSGNRSFFLFPAREAINPAITAPPRAASKIFLFLLLIRYLFLMMTHWIIVITYEAALKFIQWKNVARGCIHSQQEYKGKILCLSKAGYELKLPGS